MGNKGMCYINNGVVEAMILTDKPYPSGFVKGRLKGRLDKQHRVYENNCKNKKEQLFSLPFDTMVSLVSNDSSFIKERMLLETNNKCEICGINSWNDKELFLELDHINGDHRNNSRSNLRILCPNCHSQTPTFRNMQRNSNPFLKKVQEEDFVNALRNSSSIRSCLLKLKLSPRGGNYQRAHELICKYDIKMGS